MNIILFLGFSGSGKTTALTSISSAIRKHHLGKVGSIKRVHEKEFSIDSKGKDTWLHANSGSSVVLVFAKKELDIIKKKDTRSVKLDEILEIFRGSKVDYLLVEGLHKKFERMKGVKRIVCAKSKLQAIELMKIHRGQILFCTGRFTCRSKTKEINGIPVLRFPRDIGMAIRLING
jgi:molybdopterin-guanine dinucleotide biosynthesis adapter protein